MWLFCDAAQAEQPRLMLQAPEQYFPELSAGYTQELKELISSYQSMREGGRGPAICASIIETSRQVNLDRDVKLPEENPADLSVDARDNVVGQVYRRYAGTDALALSALPARSFEAFEARITSHS